MALRFLVDTSVIKRLAQPAVRQVVEPLAEAGELARARITDLEVITAGPFRCSGCWLSESSVVARSPICSSLRRPRITVSPCCTTTPTSTRFPWRPVSPVSGWCLPAPSADSDGSAAALAVGGFSVTDLRFFAGPTPPSEPTDRRAGRRTLPGRRAPLLRPEALSRRAIRRSRPGSATGFRHPPPGTPGAGLR